MKNSARKTPTPRTWSATTNDTYMLTARLPLGLMAKLRTHVEYTGHTITDTVEAALTEYLKEHSPMEQLQEGEAEK